METRLSNIEVLDGWLNYLQQGDMLGSVVGRSRSTITAIVHRMSLVEKDAVWILECPLLGEPGADFGLRYNTKSFFENSFFVGKAERFNHFFEVYARTVGAQKNFMLELDTAVGSGSQLAVFLDIQERAEQAIAKALGFNSEARRVPAVQKILAVAKDLQPLSFCFIYGRANLPLRLTFRAKEPHTCAGVISFVEKLEQSRQSKAFAKAMEKNEQFKELQVDSAILKDLRTISQLDIFDCSLNVDLFPDGNLGPIYGLDLELRGKTVAEQERILGSDQFCRFYELLSKSNVMDNRFNCINKSIFAVPLPHESGQQEYLTSIIAGFKLRYKQGKRLPAKIFFQGSRG